MKTKPKTGFPQKLFSILTIDKQDLKSTNYDLMIFDINGCLVFAQTLNMNQHTLTLNLSSGTYLIEIYDGDKIYSEKMVVQNE